MWVVVKNYGPFLGTLNNRCRTILRTPKRTMILTTTHVDKVYKAKALNPKPLESLKGLET